jgi:hypothetical protein
MKTIWCGSTVLAAIILLNTAPELGITQASATDFCVQLTRAEFPQSRKRAGRHNDCSSDSAFFTARSRARNNAINALAFACTNNITADIAGAACTRVGMTVNTSAFFVFPPGSLHSVGDETSNIGHGRGTAAAMNLCVIAEDLSNDVTVGIDTSCWPNSRRFSAVARARARCAIVCQN